MKIKLSVDPGYSFDVLAINEVKVLKSHDREAKEKLLKNIEEISTEIAAQIGDELFIKIVKSEEYQRLFDSNLKTFELVDMAEESEGIGRMVARANIDRYLDKTKLQKKFFDCDPSEVKISKL